MDTYSEYSRFITNNRTQVRNSSKCTCIGCMSTINSSQITEFAYPDTTAICPICFTDAIIPHSMHIPSNDELLKWNKFIFQPVEKMLDQ